MNAPQIQKAKVCPFCGCQPAVGPFTDMEEGIGSWGYVACVNEKCNVQPRVADGHEGKEFLTGDQYKALAVERWNTRKEII